MAEQQLQAVMLRMAELASCNVEGVSGDGTALEGVLSKVEQHMEGLTRELSQSLKEAAEAEETAAVLSLELDACQQVPPCPCLWCPQPSPFRWSRL